MTNRPISRRCSTLLANVLAGVLVATPPALAQDLSDPDLIAEGLRISMAACERCHVVDPARAFSGISSTPSFSLMVNHLDDWEDRFLSFFARLPHQSVIIFADAPRDADAPPMVVRIEISPRDLDAIFAYAHSLKTDE